MRAPKRLRPYLPNTSGALALVSQSDRRPFRAYWPIRVTQLIGGKRWSLSLVWHQTPGPIPSEHITPTEVWD